MPRGHSVEEMANDYAQLVDEEFGGQVDLYLGISFGGAIGVYLAANHPDHFRSIVLVGIGYEVRRGRQETRLQLRHETQRRKEERGRRDHR